MAAKPSRLQLLIPIFLVWLVPVKTPKETIAAIRGAAISTVSNPDVSKRLRDLGYVVIGDQPEEFAAHIRSEIDKLGKVIQRTGARPD